jgi:hypothetical protein
MDENRQKGELELNEYKVNFPRKSGHNEEMVLV